MRRQWLEAPVEHFVHLSCESGTEIMEYWCTENERDAKHMVGK